MQAKWSIADIAAQAEARGCPIWEIILEAEEEAHGISRQELWSRMGLSWQVMQKSLEESLQGGVKSISGLVGDEGYLLNRYLTQGKSLACGTSTLAAARAMGVAVVNAAMGRIVAAPTAGSCGILPAVLLTVAEKVKAKEEEVIGALFTAAGIGLVIDEIASTSGAKGGCQVECGSAACMAAVAAVELAGGSPVEATHAGAMALKAVIGLTCDPVAGLVEVPCVKRNAFGSVNALLAADMALAGIESKIPIDEVIGAMAEVGAIMPVSLKETARGGLANTATAKEVKAKLRKIKG